MNSPPDATFVSTNQVALAMGVSVSTIKRWVDEGILPAHKTAGGHRKLLLADVLELARNRAFPACDLTKLTRRRSGGRTSEISKLPERLHQALLTGDREAVREVIIGAYRQGTSLEELADTVIAPAMRRVGHDWEVGRIDVMHEHRGTQICAAALFELKAVLDARAGKTRPVAVGGAIEDDYSILPTLLAQLVLIDAGWDAVNLGPHTPLQSFERALVDLHPKLLWLSVSHLVAADKFLQDYRRLSKLAKDRGIAIAIGGRALAEPIRAQLSYTTFGDGLSQLAAFAHSLHPRPRPPKRGRPLKGE